MAYQKRPPAGMGVALPLLHSDQHVLEASDEKKHKLGTMLCLQDGSVFRYCKASEDINAGDPCTHIPLRNHEDTVTAAASLGDTTLTVTNGTGGTVSADAYEDGVMVIYNGSTVTTIDNIVSVAGNTGAANTGTMTVTLHDPLETAVTTADDVTMVGSKYYVQQANDQFETPVCVPRIAIDQSVAPYFWGQVKGATAMRIEDALGANDAGERALSLADGDATYLQAQAAGQVIVAQLLNAATDTAGSGEPEPVWLCIE